jgi:NADH:ubiquinone oxidoreductase subunit 5 (subunit L)/multisubunit Na+/H+ antiporter MnhA subunit
MMHSPEILLPLIVFVPFAAAAAAMALGRIVGRRIGVLMPLSAIPSFIASLWLFIQGRGHEDVVIYSAPWIEALNINFSFQADSFGLFFALLVSGIGACVGIYSVTYIPKLDNARIGRYYAALIGFMAAMLGVSLADDLILLFIFWEITSITSFILIGFWYEEDNGRKGANTALQVTVLGGLAMMVGFIFVGVITGTFSVRELAGNEALASSPYIGVALILILGGTFTKSAQWPFHFWLPNAMVAPTPVSTYLHSATMVKAGVFLMGRILPVFSEVPSWSPLLTTFGLITFSLTAYQALKETDLKAILARTTLSTLGLVTMLYGLKAADQDALQLFNHAAYKATLFLVAGIVEHATHTRDIRLLGGLRKAMPITFILCCLGALSMAGLPPFFGFLAKESLYASLLENEVLHHAPMIKWLVIAMAVATNAFLFAVSWKLIIGIFGGKSRSEHTEHAHDAEPGLWIPTAIIASFALLMGLVGGFGHITESIVNSFSSDPHAHLHVSVMPSHIGPVILSLITIALGIALYRGRETVNRAQEKLDVFPYHQDLWDALIAGITRAAVTFSTHWQNGSLRWYLSMILLFAVGLGTHALSRGELDFTEVPINLANVEWHGVALCVLLAVAALMVVNARTRLAAALALTANGFLTALLFVTYHSPDILLTQILIETVSTIFILLIIFFMPAFRPDRSPAIKKVVNLAIALAVGAFMFTYVLLTTSPQFKTMDNLSGEYLARALDEAGGANAVNVIIVDFRAIDTTGEITVLVLVGLCVFGLLRSRRSKGDVK